MRATLLLLALASCEAPPPPIALEIDCGVVRADDLPTCLRYAQLVDEYRPQVLAAFPGSIARPLDLWVKPTLEEGRSGEGFNKVAFPSLEPLYVVVTECDGNQDLARFILVHELVHHSMGGVWTALSGAYWEGIADALALECVPNAIPAIRTNRVLATAVAFGEFPFQVRFPTQRCRDRRSHAPVVDGSITWERATPYDEPFRYLTWDVTSSNVRRVLGVADLLHTFGSLWFLMHEEEFDIEELHRLCAKAKAEGASLLPPEWIYERCERIPTGAPGDGWPELLGSMLTASDAPALCAQLSEELASFLEGTEGLLCGTCSPGEILQNHPAEFLFADGSTYGLRDSPALHEALRESQQSAP